MAEPSTDEREGFTDIVLSIDGHHGLDDPMVMRALDPAILKIEKWIGCDVLISSHHCNDDGETFRTVRDERDRLRALLAAHPVQVTTAEAEWQPGRWWRSIEPDGTLWGESSNEAEIRRMARKRHTIQRLWITVPVEQWRDAK